MKALKWLVDLEDQRQTHALGHRPDKVRINWGALISRECLDTFQAIIEAVICLTAATLDENEQALFKLEQPFRFEDDARVLIKGLRKLFPEVEVNPHINSAELYRLHVVKKFNWLSIA